MIRRQIIPTALALTSLSLAATARAQEPDAAPTPQGTAGQAAASSGSTEIEGQGKFAAASDPSAASAESEENQDVTDFNISAGGIFSAGNAESAAVTGALNLRLRRKDHQFSAIGAGNWGASANDKDEWVDTVGNAQGRVRYDYFLGKRWSLFLMTTARHDPFQGLDLRLNIDPGVAFYAISSAKNRLWFEAGYDLQHDIRRDEAIVAVGPSGGAILDADGNAIEVADKTFSNHAARVFAGYSNRMTDKVSFDTGFEWLQSIIDGGTYRFVFDAGLTAQLAERLAVSSTFTLRYENKPLPEVKKLDTITALNLVYRFF